MTASARTPVLPGATPVGVLSVQLRHRLSGLKPSGVRGARRDARPYRDRTRKSKDLNLDFVRPDLILFRPARIPFPTIWISFRGIWKCVNAPASSAALRCSLQASEFLIVSAGIRISPSWLRPEGRDSLPANESTRFLRGGALDNEEKGYPAAPLGDHAPFRL
jgi:hypothetical protein